MPSAQPPDPDWLYAVIGLKTHHVIAGAVGGVARGLVSKGIPWSQRVVSGIVGAMVAGYGTPLATPIMQELVELVHVWIGAEPAPVQNIEGSTGFALGLVAMTVCDFVIRASKRWLDKKTPSAGQED